MCNLYLYTSPEQCYLAECAAGLRLQSLNFTKAKARFQSLGCNDVIMHADRTLKKPFYCGKVHLVT